MKPGTLVRSSARSRRRSSAAALAALTALAGCAQYGAPPGGMEDERMPMVVATVPEPFAVVPGFEGEVVIRFDERVSERGIEDAILVSPATGEVTVEHDGEELRVRIAGGWRPDQIYRVIIRPVLVDLFGNTRTDPAELVFSTGPPIPPTALAGELIDRVTGKPPESGYVHAVRRADSVVYLAVVEADGFFSALNLPNGIYDVVGFIDANRNDRRDPNEPASPVEQVSLSNDTVALALAALPFDTTAARAVSATADSVHVEVAFDDALDPTQPSDSMRANLYSLPDTSAVLNAFEVLWPWEYAERTAAARAAATAADTMPADTLAAAADSLRAPPRAAPAEPAATPGAAASAEPLPPRAVVVVPRRPLAPGEYLVEVTGVVNINGYRNGGGRVRVSVPEPAAAPSPADTTAVPPADTTAAPPPADTTAAPPPADTMAPPRRRVPR